MHYRASSTYRWEVEAFLVSRSIARDALTAGRVKRLAQIDTENLGTYALYQDGSSADLARRAVEVLVAHVQATRSD